MAMSIAGLRRDPAHLRQADVGGEGVDAPVDGGDVDAGNGAHVEVHAARHGHDVGRRAAVDARHLQRGVRRIEARILRAQFQLVLDVGQLAQELAGDGDGVDAERRHARMRGAALDLDVPAHRALVAIDDAHRRRLADQHHARLDEAAAELGDHRAHAEAADLLVVGEGEMDRHGELALR